MANPFPDSQALHDQFEKVKKQQAALEGAINNFDQTAYAAAPADATKAQIENVRSTFNTAWSAQETEITNFPKNLNHKEASAELKKIHDNFQSKLQAVAVNSASKTQEAEKAALAKQFNDLAAERQKLLNKAEEDKKYRIYHAIHAFYKLTKKSQGQNLSLINNSTPVDKKISPEDMQKYQKLVVNFEKKQLQVEGFRVIQHTPGDGKKQKESLTVDTSRWPWKKDENEKTAAMAVIQAASLGWSNLTITGGKENERIASVKQVLTLKGMRASITAVEGKSLSAKEQQWNGILSIKEDVIKKQELLSDQSELSATYLALNQTQRGLFFSALGADHLEEIADDLQKKDVAAATTPTPTNHVGLLHHELATFITNKENKKSPLVEDFVSLSKEIKVDTLFAAARNELQSGKTNSDTLKPHLEKLNFAESCQLLDGIEKDKTFQQAIAASNQYPAAFEQAVGSHLLNYCQKQPVDFNDAENLNAFTKTNVSQQVSILYNLPSNTREALIDKLETTPGALADIYLDPKLKSGQSQALVSSLNTAHIEKLAAGLEKKTSSEIANFYTQLVDSALKGSAQFLKLSSERKVAAVHQFAEQEAAKPAGTAIEPEKLQPLLKSMNFAELCGVVEKGANDYSKKLADIAVSQMADSNKQNPTAFPIAANDAFNKLKPARKAQVISQLPSATQKTLIDELRKTTNGFVDAVFAFATQEATKPETLQPLLKNMNFGELCGVLQKTEADPALTNTLLRDNIANQLHELHEQNENKNISLFLKAGLSQISPSKQWELILRASDAKRDELIKAIDGDKGLLDICLKLNNPNKDFFPHVEATRIASIASAANIDGKKDEFYKKLAGFFTSIESANNSPLVKNFNQINPTSKKEIIINLVKKDVIPQELEPLLAAKNWDTDDLCDLAETLEKDRRFTKPLKEVFVKSLAEMYNKTTEPALSFEPKLQSIGMQELVKAEAGKFQNAPLSWIKNHLPGNSKTNDSSDDHENSILLDEHSSPTHSL